MLRHAIQHNDIIDIINYAVSSRCRVDKKRHKNGMDWLWTTRNRVFIGIRNLSWLRDAPFYLAVAATVVSQLSL